MNNITNILYNLTIYPFELIIDIISTMFSKTDLGIKLILTGIFVNIIALPLYNIADKLQKRELDLQKYFKPKIDDIKAVFKGDKRQMLIQTFYRINNYHPIYSLRGLFGLLIQVPIFIAAYKAIIAMSYSTSFLMIKDLSKPDALIHMGSLYVNIMPVIMTLVNILASIIHTRELSNKERTPLFVMAGLFLVILYNSPSALLVYWTTTNLFSLVKNIVLLNPKPIVNFFKKTKIFWIVLSVVWLLSPLLFYFQIFMAGTDTFRIINPGIVLIIAIYIYALTTGKKVSLNYKSDDKIFLISTISLSILFGLFIPSNLIGSSPQEFENPIHIIVNTVSKSAGIFILYPMLMYFSSSEKIKRMLTIIMTFVFISAFVNTFIFTGNYGTLSSNMVFENKDVLITNSLDKILTIASLLVIIIFIWKKLFYKSIFKTVSAMSIIILLFISCFNLYNIDKETKNLLSSKSEVKSNVSKIIDMSKDGLNVFVFFFDASVPSHIPKIIERMPELKNELDGFVFYENTLSFSAHTASSISALLGGYEYRVLEMNKRSKETLKDKHDESTLVLPLIFRSNNYSSTVIYPTYAGWQWEPDISAFKKYPDLKAYSRAFAVSMSKETDEMKRYFDNIILNFSLFKISPMFLRHFIYNDGKWIFNKYSLGIPNEILNYTYLKEVTNMINIVSNTNTYTYFGNDMTHDYHSFNSNYLPELEKKEVPKEDIDKYGNENTARRMYANVRMLIEIANFVKYLKEHDMYDNAKIIVISDHGDMGVNPPVFDVSNKGFSDEANKKVQALHTTLLIKDFNSKGSLKTDKTNFMTIADMPIIATKHLGTVYNPFTQKELKADKEDGIIATMTPFSIRGQNKNTFIINSALHIKNGNIFDMSNWTELSNR